MRIRGRHYATGEPVVVTLDGPAVASVRPGGGAADAAAGWVAPALFDLQINGAGGRAFNSPDLTPGDVRAVAGACARRGIAGLLPTLITGPFDALEHGFRTLARARRDPELARRIPGFHLEGPYISPEDGPRGAHPREHVRPPDRDEFRRWQDAAEGRIRLVTLAPEVPGAIPFIEHLAGSGVVVAIGHTAASPAVIRDAVRAGARLSTHLGNGCHALLPRHESYLWEQLAADGLWASLITDGHHLPEAVVKCFVRVKTPARLILTCDASSLAGLPPGRYREWGQELEVRADGRVGVAGTPFLAGSGVFTDVCVANVIRMAGVSLAEAIDMAAVRPRELLGLPVPRLEPGAPADLMLFDWEPGGELAVRALVCEGRIDTAGGGR
ncbi:MAG TPA: amidohydrolase family protein [Gemmataceae bacterium]